MGANQSVGSAWCNPPAELKEKIFALSGSFDTFLSPVPGQDFDFNLEAAMEDIQALLALDNRLTKMQSRLVPRKVAEEVFWHNYFTHLRSLANMSGEVSASASIETSTAGIAPPPAPRTFQAFVLHDGVSSPKIETLSVNDLPEGDILVNVQYSSINHRDGLSVMNKCRVARVFPMVPGIDAIGTIESSETSKFKKGDKVFICGSGLGESTWGGYASLWRGKSDLALRIPEALSTHMAAALGTPGLVAALALIRLEAAGVKPGDGKVLVTGASGGVGSILVALLASAGYTVVAATGRKKYCTERLTNLGASEIIDREALVVTKPLGEEKYRAVVDVCGGTTLVHALAQVVYGGIAVVCGFGEALQLQGSLAPFVLRGVTLCGVEVFRAPSAQREAAWARILQWATSSAASSKLSLLATTIKFEDIYEGCRALMDSRVLGRLVVDIVPRPAYKVVFVLGGPGAGKGTQCAKLVEKFGFKHLSAGDLLRAEVKSGSPQGEMIANMIKEGQIVPGHITIGLLKQEMEKDPSAVYLIDGFPREMQQAIDFETQISECRFTLFFDCPEDIMESRLLQRGLTSGRTDDNIESIKKRFRTFVETSMPVIQLLEGRNKVRRVSATQTPDEVFQSLVQFFKDDGLIA